MVIPYILAMCDHMVKLEIYLSLWDKKGINTNFAKITILSEQCQNLLSYMEFHNFDVFKQKCKNSSIIFQYSYTNIRVLNTLNEMVNK